jgi:glycosyltransferase involved in cell wall biosynthesis
MTLVVIPAFNEQSTVGEVVRTVASIGLDCVVVDDGSTDDTAAVARGAGALVVRLPVNLGVGAALRAGFRYAVRNGYRRAIQVDADLQHDPGSIPDLVAAADAGAHLVIGSRFAAGYEVGKSRRLVMRALARLVSRRVGVPLDDVTSGFRAISEPLLSHFADDYPADFLGDTVEAIVIAHEFGATVAQVPVTMAQRRVGAATSGARAFGHLLRLLLVLSIRPIRHRR